MSNVKVNGNTYNDVSSIRLMKADNSGYATFVEGETSGGDYLQSLMDASGASFPGYDNSDLTGEVSLGWLCGVNNANAEVNLPNVTKISGGIPSATLKSIKVPKATTLGGGKVAMWFQIRGTYDLLDFSGIVSGTWNQTFYGCQIGTLKLGAFVPSNGAFQNATITNLIWNNPNITPRTDATSAELMAGGQGLNSATTITNAYVPDVYYDEIKALKDAGTLTKVTNLYKLSEWSGE